MGKLYFETIKKSFKVDFLDLVCKFWSFISSFLIRIQDKNVTAESGERRIKRFFKIARLKAKSYDRYDSSFSKFLIAKNEMFHKQLEYLNELQSRGFECGSMIRDTEQKIILNRHEMNRFKKYLISLEEDLARAYKEVADGKVLQGKCTDEPAQTVIQID